MTYILGGWQSDFSKNWARQAAGLPLDPRNPTGGAMAPGPATMTA